MRRDLCLDENKAPVRLRVRRLNPDTADPTQAQRRPWFGFPARSSETRTRDAAGDKYVVVSPPGVEARYRDGPPSAFGMEIVG